jgi:signal transduction histidine kinase
MIEDILKIKIQNDLDVVLAYKRALQLAEFTGLPLSSQTKFATAVSEISRNVLEHVGLGHIKFRIVEQNTRFLEAVVTDKGKGIRNVEQLLSKKFLPIQNKGKGCGIFNAQRLVDHFSIESKEDQGTTVIMRKKILVSQPIISKHTIEEWKKYFEREVPFSPYEELKKQNLLLIAMMEELRLKDLESAHQIEEIKKLNKDLDQFAYTVSHDLKAPLRNIEGLITIVEENISEGNSTEALETTGMVRGQLSRMNKLIHDILHYSKTGRQSLEKKEVDLHQLIEEITGTLLIPEGFKIRINDFCKLYTEEIYLTQIFSNLISNAIKHHDKSKGEICISCQEENDNFKFSVSDDGPGIPAENQTKVFNIFEGSSSTKIDSTGVGLTIVQKIVKEKGGKIWVESKGRGTKFVFTWPVEEILKTEKCTSI